MKEVKLKRVAGPFDEIPFQNYMQSPIGLVPKAGGDQTRLIFHLSYDFSDGHKSLNANTPKEKCTIKYCDIDHAVRSMLKLKQEEEMKCNRASDYRPVIIFTGKSDIKSAFCILPLLAKCWPWLIMMAQNPKTKKWQFFVDKCLPFGASISCALFPRVSDALKHIVQVRTNSPITNYLDDFLFMVITIYQCNCLLQEFLDICDQVRFPVALDKTKWASEIIVFLAILLDGKHYVLSIPLDKKTRAEEMLKLLMSKSKATVKDLQMLCGFLSVSRQSIHETDVCKIQWCCSLQPV